MRLYNTLTRSTEELHLTTKDTFRIYTCGITPYDSAHVGHASVYLTYDLIRRRLEDQNYKIKLVRNITDVDDDILKKSNQLGVNYLDLALAEIKKFDMVMTALRIKQPESEPRATSAISQILNLTGELLNSGHAYIQSGSVYLDSKSFSDFGRLSQLNRQEMLRLADERGGMVNDVNKKDPLDAVIWQKKKEGEPFWESRWGPGRPGWHIECAAMCLNEHEHEIIDVHGGGTDLIFPHHEYERLEMNAVTHAEQVKTWVHTAMVYYGGEKMSKSLGNLVFVEDLLNRYDPMAIRICLMQHHYRSSWEFNEEELKCAQELSSLFKFCKDGDAALDEVRNALDDDLNTPQAIAILEEYARLGEPVSNALQLLGIEYNDRV